MYTHSMAGSSSGAFFSRLRGIEKVGAVLCQHVFAYNLLSTKLEAAWIPSRPEVRPNACAKALNTTQFILVMPSDSRGLQKSGKHQYLSRDNHLLHRFSAITYTLRSIWRPAGSWLAFLSRWHPYWKSLCSFNTLWCLHNLDSPMYSVVITVNWFLPCLDKSSSTCVLLLIVLCGPFFVLSASK